MWTKTELALEQTQQGVSDEVLVGPHGSEDSYKDGHGGSQSSQEGKRLQDNDKRLDLADDLKEAQDHIQVKLKEQRSNGLKPESYHYTKSQDKRSKKTKIYAQMIGKTISY
ncbi:hypothetical protein Tco_1098004 [Tanacetum coccineum]